MNDTTRKSLQAWVDEATFPVVAKALNVSENSIARWLAGLSHPHPNSAEKLEAALKERGAA